MRLGLAHPFLLLAAHSALALSPVDPEPRFLQLVQQARAAQKNKDYPKAERIYREIVALRPNDPVAHQNLGLACYLQAKYAEAVPSLENAVRMDPTLFGANLYLGICYYRTNQFSKALPLLETAQRLNPKDFMPRYWLGASLLAMKSLPEAISALESAAEISPKDQEALYLLARAYAEYAADWLKRLLRVAPASVAAHRLRAEDALAQGMPRPAVVELEKAMAMRPDDPGLRQLLQSARQAADTGQTFIPPVLVRPAVEMPADRLLALLRGRPDDPDLLYLLGKTYEARSAEVGNRLFQLHPGSYRVLFMRGEAYEKSDQQDYEKALAEYLKALELKPDLPGIHYAVGRVLWKMRRWEEAVFHLKKELARNPHHGLANYYLGNCYLFLERTPEAIQFLEAALRAQPGLTQAHRDLGRALAKSGRFEDALACYRRVLEADPEDPSVHAMMATAYRALGKPEEARQAAETARRLSISKNQPVQ